MRELIATRLESTIVEPYRPIEIVDDVSGEPFLVTNPVTAPMLAIRLKALDQLTRLCGVNLPSKLH
ncbi:hypothetical protein [Prosthecobacter sp.]|uniref:hypothetical protein n=1 Tax=Prosthecobacter sp. TaxID=1965333 RepID=UPI0037833AAA